MITKPNWWLLMLLIMGAVFQMRIITTFPLNIAASVPNLSMSPHCNPLITQTNKNWATDETFSVIKLQVIQYHNTQINHPFFFEVFSCKYSGRHSMRCIPLLYFKQIALKCPFLKVQDKLVSVTRLLILKITLLAVLKQIFSVE